MDYLNDEICHVATWLKANKMFIKVKKTKIIIFRTTQKFLTTRLLKIDNTIIEDFNVFTGSIQRGKYILTTFVQAFRKQYECYIKQGFMFLENLFCCLILMPLAILCSGSFEVVPAPVHAVIFPVFPCLFGPLLWLLLAIKIFIVWLAPKAGHIIY